MKNFNKFITEKTSDEDLAADGVDFTNDVSNPKMVERINGFLGAKLRLGAATLHQQIQAVVQRSASLGSHFRKSV